MDIPPAGLGPSPTVLPLEMKVGSWRVSGLRGRGTYGIHPSVPRLLDTGVWQSPEGGVHPFIVMEWVEGEPLYEWAARRNPSSRQVLALLSQAAGALQAIHDSKKRRRRVSRPPRRLDMYQGSCHIPFFESSRVPTSAPQEQ